MLRNKIYLIWVVIALYYVAAMGVFILFHTAQFAIWVENEWGKKTYENLIAISFSRNKTSHWQRVGKEFKIENYFYDVVKTEVTADSTLYYCLNDHNEEELFRWFQNFLNSTKQSNPKNPLAKITGKIASTPILNDSEKITNQIPTYGSPANSSFPVPAKEAYNPLYKKNAKPPEPLN